MVTICHASDWHGHWYELPPADLYIFTGDMLPNFPHLTRNFRIKEYNEINRQTTWIRDLANAEPGGLRRFLGNPDAPVALVRGNHDFIDIGRFFGGEYFEVTPYAGECKEFCGLRIGGFRGIPPIGGYWSDEITQVERAARIRDMPGDLDVIICHPPPKGILACIWGCVELRTKVDLWEMFDNGPKLICFGHIHEEGGKVIERENIIYSNASLKHNIIELD